MTLEKDTAKPHLTSKINKKHTYSNSAINMDSWKLLMSCCWVVAEFVQRNGGCVSVAESECEFVQVVRSQHEQGDGRQSDKYELSTIDHRH